MPRAKYRVTYHDLDHVSAYLSDRLQLQQIEIRGDTLLPKARSEFFEIVQLGQRKDRAERLNTWCEKYLPSSEWEKLKAAVRKRRERQNRHDQKKSVSISANAYRLLVKLAKRDGVTLSEFIERKLRNR